MCEDHMSCFLFTKKAVFVYQFEGVDIIAIFFVTCIICVCKSDILEFGASNCVLSICTNFAAEYIII